MLIKLLIKHVQTQSLVVLLRLFQYLETHIQTPPNPCSVTKENHVDSNCYVTMFFVNFFLLKCRLQAQGAIASAVAGAGATVTAVVRYSGPLDVAKQVLRSEGGPIGLFKGLVPTMAREVPGNAAMFGVYEALKQYFAGGTDTSGLDRGSMIIAGGLAGGAFWISVYPTDVIKSAIQIDDYKNPKYFGSIDAFKKILKSEGVGGLYKGFGPAMGRSVPANAACFLAYEVVRSSLG